MTTNALVLVDFQKAYFNNQALKAVRPSLVAHANDLITQMRDEKYPIFLVRTEHAHDGSTWTLNMHDDGDGYLLSGNPDASVLDDLDIDGTIEVIKTRDSAFFGTNFEALLRTMGISQLILCGVSTHTCVAQTAADAYAANFRVLLARDAIASHQPRFDAQVYEILKTEYRQDIRSNDEIFRLFGNHTEELLRHDE